MNCKVPNLDPTHHLPIGAASRSRPQAMVKKNRLIKLVLRMLLFPSAITTKTKGQPMPTHKT